MPQTTDPRTEAAPAPPNARHSSALDRASANPRAARWIGSARGRAPAPARNVRLRQSSRRSLPLPGLRASFRSRSACGLGVIVFPVPLLLQLVGDFLGHVGLVMLGEHSVGAEHAGTVERTFGDHALPFAEQIGEDSLVSDLQLGVVVL